jgi:AraC-like DNA-binding protein
MLPATLEEFARDPVGRYIADARFVHFCAHAQLWGVLLWGRPSSDDAHRLGRSLVLELGPRAEPHVSIVDASRLEGGDDEAFRDLERYVTGHAELLRRWVLRLALVRPRGITGALVAGAYEVIPRPYPVAVFDDPLAALQWLAPHAPEALLRPDTMARALSDLQASVTGTPPLLQSLRTLLDGRPGGLALADAAPLLAVSSRSLQRRLLAAGTTFQLEVTAARIRAAKRHLEGDAPLGSVAVDSGFASPQSFNATFRRSTGVSPSAWRKQRHGERGVVGRR